MGFPVFMVLESVASSRVAVSLLKQTLTFCRCLFEDTVREGRRNSLRHGREGTRKVAQARTKERRNGPVVLARRGVSSCEARVPSGLGLPRTQVERMDESWERGRGTHFPCNVSWV